MNMFEMLYIHLPDDQNHVFMLIHVKNKNMWLCWLGKFPLLILPLSFGHEKWFSTWELPTLLNTTCNHKTKIIWTYWHWLWSNKGWNWKDVICRVQNWYWMYCYEWKWYKKVCKCLVTIIIGELILTTDKKSTKKESKLSQLELIPK